VIGRRGSRAGSAAVERDAAAPREVVQLCSFLVGGEAYAVDIMRIKEIVNPLPVTPVPRSPPFVEGVIEMRGAILPVVDLRKRFELASPAGGRGTKFLIVALAGTEGERWIVGVVVDRVLEVLRIPRDDLRQPPPVALDREARYFAGVCRHRDRIVFLLDLDALLSPSERHGLLGMSEAAVPAVPLPPPRSPVPVPRQRPGDGGGRP
jgi:purine-binding chemotaxis protein CheW